MYLKLSCIIFTWGVSLNLGHTMDASVTDPNTQKQQIENLKRQYRLSTSEFDLLLPEIMKGAKDLELPLGDYATIYLSDLANNKPPKESQKEPENPPLVASSKNVQIIDEALSALFFLMEENQEKKGQWSADQLRRLQQIFNDLSYEQLQDPRLLEWMQGKPQFITEPYQKTLFAKEVEYSKRRVEQQIMLGKPQALGTDVIGALAQLIEEKKGKDDEWSQDQLKRLHQVFANLSLEQLQDPNLMIWMQGKSVHILHAHGDALFAKQALVFKEVVEKAEQQHTQLKGHLYFATSPEGKHPGLLRRENSSGRDNNCLLYSIIGDNVELLTRIMGDKNQALTILNSVNSENTIEDHLSAFNTFINLKGEEADKELIFQLEFLPFVEPPERKQILDKLQNFINKNFQITDERSYAQGVLNDLSVRLAEPQKKTDQIVPEQDRDYQVVRRKIFDDILRAMNDKENGGIISRLMLDIRAKASNDVKGNSVKEFLDNLYQKKTLLFHEFASIISLLYGINVKVLQQSNYSDKVLTPSELEEEGLDEVMQGYHPEGPVIYVYNPGWYAGHYQKLHTLG